MKKVFLFIFSLVLAFSVSYLVNEAVGKNAGVPQVYADTVADGTCGTSLTWTLDDEGTLTISGSGDMTNYSKGGTPWYSNRESITSVVIGSSVTSIGDYAFYDCSNIVGEFIVPSSVTKIGENVINSNGLTGLYYNGDLLGWCNIQFYTYGNNPLQYAHNLYIKDNDEYILVEDITIPAELTYIRSYTFQYCDSLTSVTIGDNITNIAERAFYGCSRLTGEVVIPDSVSVIGTYAFANCIGITSVVLPNELSILGSGIFYGCSELTNINIPSELTKIGLATFEGCSALACSLTIPSGVKEIGRYAFNNCSSLTSVVIENGIETISMYAFNGCSSLENLVVPDSLSVFPGNCFDGCNNLSCNEYDNAYYLGNENNPYVILVKAKNNSITTCEINHNTKFINSRAFENCSRITELYIPNGVLGICIEAFLNCSGMTYIEIPDSINESGMNEKIFNGCSSLIGIKIPFIYRSSYITNPYSGYKQALLGNLFSDTYYSGSRYISQYCGTNYGFYFPSALGYVFVSRGKLAYGAFSNCTSLTEIVLGSDVTNIYRAAFSGCSQLEKVVLPDGLIDIGGYAFNNCSKLEVVEIPNSVTSIDISAFNNCTALENINVYGATTTIGASAIHETVTIYGVTGSPAETYATSRGNTFIPLPSVTSAQLAINESLNIIYTVTAYGDFAGEPMDFTVDGDTVSVNAVATGNDNEYTYTLRGISPEHIGDNIKASFTMGVNEYVAKTDYSIKNYCTNVFSATDDDYLKALIKQILNYGATAQLYTEHNTGSLVNAGYTEGVVTDTGITESERELTTETGADAEHYAFTGASAVFSSTVSLKFKFIAEDVGNVKVTVQKGAGAVKAYTEFDGDAGAYSLTTAGLTATEYDDAFTVCLYVDEGEGYVLYQTVTYNVRSYVYAMQDREVDSVLTPMANLARAVYNYGEAVKAYVASLA